ncbi:SprT family protein [Liquorilactobacillus satsumensis]|uniref:SprT family protein n=1 Tax=Liquorilactobacillus satsumensis TaxID=259059 RepID=UPI0021C2FCB0|nr:SprT family protein [Liquorilactobacillus satsumensis]MCP9328159.1 SprT family protein [Liquorilactobacillus satsumensis]
MKDDQLQTLVTQISQHFFQLEFKHKATFNKRLRTTGGRYLLEQHDIEINPRMAVLGNGVLIGIIKHELCHYHLHLQHLGYRHRDHAFKELLLQVGGLRYAPRTAAPVWKYKYRCRNCGQLYFRQRKINRRRYVCGNCHGVLEICAKRNVKKLASDA